MHRGRTVSTGSVDSGQSMDRPTTTAESLLLFHRTRVQASAAGCHRKSPAVTVTSAPHTARRTEPVIETLFIEPILLMFSLMNFSLSLFAALAPSGSIAGGFRL